MTKKKRELIEILLDNVKPEDWPESLQYAAQDIKSMDVNYPIYAYQCKPVNSDAFPEMWNQIEYSKAVKIGITPKDLCKNWSKTIVHRDEFMKRWNERNTPVEVKTLTFSREVIDPVILTEKMEKISIKPDADSEGWIEWNGGEMPVEKGTLIDVKYRCGIVNLHVRAGELPGCGSITYRHAIDFKHDDNPDDDIIAYRLHVQKEQKTPQQLALEKFGTGWHENEGRIPRTGRALIDIEFSNGRLYESELASYWAWEPSQSTHITRWRIHSETDTTTPPTQQEAHTEETKPIHQEVKATNTQIGGNHYTKLAIQPMRYSMLTRSFLAFNAICTTILVFIFHP